MLEHVSPLVGFSNLAEYLEIANQSTPMKTLRSFAELAHAFERNGKQMHIDMAAAMKTSAIALVAEIKAEFEQGAGEPGNWAELKEATKAERARKEIPEDVPLAGSGVLRDSIQYRSTDMSLSVVSDSEVARYQEFGTPTIPPRALLVPALHRAIPNILNTVGKTIEQSLAGEK
jgi:hypothetical protein